MLIDKDKDGKLSLTELKDAVKRVLNDADSDFMNALFTEIDVDSNGTVEYNEFLSAASNKEQLLCDDHLEQAFKKIDFNHDGFITSKEIQKAFGIDASEID
jgi:calcium-dependent protein kinase